ncbi:MAG: hypothetical protein V2I36_00165 [Desulfopila sp.]|nr:hypothetical protein [Desulfopila sp.]
MKSVMIHDIQKKYFDLPLYRYHLTFDDGLFSQYYYYPLLQVHQKELLYFIPSSFIRPGEGRDMFAGKHIEYLKSKKYMHKALIQRKFEAFMRLEELQDLAKADNVRLGVHSHFHDVILTRSHPKKRKPLSKWKLDHIGYPLDTPADAFSIRSRLAFQGYYLHHGRPVRRTRDQWLDYIKYDTESALQWFAANLGLIPDAYCFPFNEHNQMLIDILKRFGFRDFYSARQIPPCCDIHTRVDIDAIALNCPKDIRQKQHPHHSNSG